MPSGFLHQLCAARASGMAGITPVHGDVMVLGAQGPDPLFMLGIFPLRPSSKPSKLGNTLHSRRTGAFLMELCRRARVGDGVDRAYALGFLTHYALDSTVHPYVYAQSNREDGAYSSTKHVMLEKSWDTLFFRQEGNATGTPLLMPGAEEARTHWPRIATLWQGAIDAVYPEEAVTEAMILRALEGAARANRLTHSPRGIKYRLVWLAERIIGKPGLGTAQMAPVRPMPGDITNEEGRAWRSPFAPEVERREGLQALLERATCRAAELITAASRYFSDEIDEDTLRGIIGNVGYDSGLESAD